MEIGMVIVRHGSVSTFIIWCEPLSSIESGVKDHKEAGIKCLVLVLS